MADLQTYNSKIKHRCLKKRVSEDDGVFCITRTKEHKSLTFFEKPLNIGLVSGGSVLAGLTAIPVLLKLFKFF